MTDVPNEPLMATMPPGSVIITPTQMYAEIRVMSGKVDHLASVLDPALSTIREDVADVRGNILKEVAASKVIHDDHESRLRSLDRRLWLSAVAAAAGGAGIAQIAAIFAE